MDKMSMNEHNHDRNHGDQYKQIKQKQKKMAWFHAEINILIKQ